MTALLGHKTFCADQETVVAALLMVLFTASSFPASVEHRPRQSAVSPRRQRPQAVQRQRLRDPAHHPAGTYLTYPLPTSLNQCDTYITYVCPVVQHHQQDVAVAQAGCDIVCRFIHPLPLPSAQPTHTPAAATSPLLCSDPLDTLLARPLHATKATATTTSSSSFSASYNSRLCASMTDT